VLGRIDDDKKYGGKGKQYNRNAFIFNVCFGTSPLRAGVLKPNVELSTGPDRSVRA
jgi:hypothetical protein